jgi:hypothetical protein
MIGSLYKNILKAIIGALALHCGLEAQVVQPLPRQATKPPALSKPTLPLTPNTAPPSQNTQGLPTLDNTLMQETTQQNTQDQILESTIDDFLSDLRTYDLSKAYYENTAESFRQEVSLPTFKAYVKTTLPLFHNKSFTLDSVSYNGVIATVKGKLVSIEGQAARCDVELVQENGIWKIRKINIFKPDL